MNEQPELVREILSDQIIFPERQMRRDIDREELHVLAESIKEKGLISPITVRPVGDKYELVAGQRRLRACGIAGIIRIPCIVRELSDSEALAIMAADNIERADVDIIDESNFIKLVMSETHASVQEMADRLNRGKQYVLDRLQIAEMPDYVQAFLKTGQLKMGVALTLAEIEPEEKRRVWIGMAIDGNISVRQAEHWVYQHKLGLLPDATPSDASEFDAPPGASNIVMFECAIDGKKYPARACRSVFIYEENMPFLEVLRAELYRASPPSESEHEGIGISG